MQGCRYDSAALFVFVIGKRLFLYRQIYKLSFFAGKDLLQLPSSFFYWRAHY